MTVQIKSKGEKPPKNAVVAPRKGDTDWELVFREYVTENLKPREGPYTLKMLAEKWKLNYKTVRNVAFEQKWNDRLSVEKHKTTEGAIDKAREVTLFDEFEIRSRHIKVARALIAKAYLRLEALADPAKDLTVKEAIEFLKLAFPVERAAAGLAETFVVQHQHQVTDFSADRVKDVAGQLIALMQEAMKEQQAIDVVPVEVKDVGSSEAKD